MSDTTTEMYVIYEKKRKNIRNYKYNTKYRIPIGIAKEYGLQVNDI